MTIDAKLKLTKAKAQLITTQPFFATLLLTTELVDDSQKTKTMSTDGKNIFYDSDFVDSLSVSELVFVLCHEVMHVVWSHSARLKNKNAKKWNVATDLVINDLLVAEKIGTMPKSGLLDSALVASCDKNAERVYLALPDDLSSEPLDELLEPKNQDGSPLDQSQQNELDAQNKVKLTLALNAQKMSGKTSANLSRLVDQIVKTKTDWREVLRRFINKKTSEYYTFSRPKRRFLADDLYLAGPDGKKLPSFFVAIDCSGSVDQKLLNKFGFEINKLVEDLDFRVDLNIIYFDSRVLKMQKIEDPTCIKLEPIGGGGTAFSPVFDAAKKLEPDFGIVLTDLESHDFGPCPDYDVLWACTSDLDHAPFGEILKIGD